MRDDSVSDQVALQRVRNRIIEYLELASSFDAQLHYQSAAPLIHVPSELVNQYEDWVADESSIEGWGAPVFSSRELSALKRFHQTWGAVAETTPGRLPPIEVTIQLPAWGELRAAAERTLGVFQSRGRLPEDCEIDGL